MAKVGRSADDVGWMVRILEDLKSGDWLRLRTGDTGMREMVVGVSYRRKRTFSGFKFIVSEVHAERLSHYLVGGYGGSEALDIQIPPKFVFVQQAASEEIDRVQSIKVISDEEAERFLR